MNFSNDTLDKFVLDIKKKGWTIIRNYTNPNICETLRKSLKIKQLPVNNNSAIPNMKGSYIFNSNVLPFYQEAFDIATDLDLRYIASEFTNDEPILKSIRTYSLPKGDPRFAWHGDNKTPEGSYDNSKGLVFVLYLTDDLKEGTFWVSNFSSFDRKANKIKLPKETTMREWERGNDINKIYANKGDLFVFDQSLFHRHVSKYSNLDILFFQIAGKSIGSCEKILIDPSMLIKNDKNLINFLGAGKKNSGFREPLTDISDFPINILLKNIIQSLKSIPRSLYEHILFFRRIKHQIYWGTDIRLKKPLQSLKYIRDFTIKNILKF